MPTAQATEEERWWRDNPAPQSTLTGEMLTLWNYPVARTGLAAGHRAAIDQFLAIEILARGSQRETVLKIRGHASPTGENLTNLDLSLLRAQAVRSYISSLGFKQMLLSNVGSREPLDDDQSGPGLARDRRVEIVKIHLTKASDSDVGPFLEDAGQTTSSSQLLGAIQAEMQFLKFGPKTLLQTPFAIDVTAIGYVKAVTKNSHPGGGAIGGAAIKLDKVSGKLEDELFDGLVGKFSIEPSKGNMPSIKVGAQLKGIFGKPEVGLQKPPKFVYVKFTSKDAVIFGDQESSYRFAFKGDITFEIGPGEAMVKRLADLEAALGGTAAAEGFTAAELEAAGIGVSGGTAGALAAVGGAIAVVAIINGGIIYAVIEAKEESETFTALLARRDGKATRVAWAILGTDYEKNYNDRENQWMRTVASAAMVDAFRQGRRDVEALIKVEESRVARIAAWKAKYAADGTTDGAVIRERVYEDVGGQEKSPDAGARL